MIEGEKMRSPLQWSSTSLRPFSLAIKVSKYSSNIAPMILELEWSVYRFSPRLKRHLTYPCYLKIWHGAWWKKVLRKGWLAEKQIEHSGMSSVGIKSLRVFLNSLWGCFWTWATQKTNGYQGWLALSGAPGRTLCQDNERITYKVETSLRHRNYSYKSPHAPGTNGEGCRS